MDANNIKIICEKWNCFTQPQELNFFSKYFQENSEKKGEIDLMEFCVKQDFIISSRGEQIDIDDENSSLELFKSYDSITLMLSNTKSQNLLNDFFRVFDTTYQNSYGLFDRYKVTVKILNKTTGIYELKFLGVLTPFDIKYNMPESINERMIIELPVYGWDKEFTDYFSNKQMPNLEDFQRTGGPLSGYRGLWLKFWTDDFHGIMGNETSDYSFENASVADIMRIAYGLKENVEFDSGINNDMDIGQWRILRNPSIRVGASNSGNNQPVYIFANGYEFIKNNLGLNMFDFLKYMCNSMGWIFYFEPVIDRMVLKITNRVTSGAGSNTIAIDYNKITGYDISFSQFSIPATVIIMSVVEFLGDGQAFSVSGTSTHEDHNKLKGAADLVFASSDLINSQPVNNLLYFPYMQRYTSGIKIRIDWFDGYLHTKFADNDTESVHYEEIRNTVTESGTYKQFVINNNYYYNNNQILHIKAGDNFFNLKYKKRLNFNTGNESMYISNEYSIEEADLIYSGNIGTGMFYGKNLVTRKGIIPYLSTTNDLSNSVKPYYQSEQIKQNFTELLSQLTNSVIEFTVDGIYENRNAVVKFLNYNISNDGKAFEGNFKIVDIETDYINEVTKFKVKKRYG